ncbi:hypothetical protein HMPREF0541_03031 [Lacticaseibacillus rhamnosus ATCC 21052]|nr:hypothetical protein HMPREF0541_03031 [Lacticaseibacillus rhamnosus ATCC 21052]
MTFISQIYQENGIITRREALTPWPSIVSAWYDTLDMLACFLVHKLVCARHNAFTSPETACKDLGRNGQRPAITPKATYTPVSNRAGSRSLSITRSPAQKSACKDLERNGQTRAITLEAAYTPTSERAGSRSHFFWRLFS